MLLVCISKSLVESCDGAALGCPLLKSSWVKAARRLLSPSLRDGFLSPVLPAELGVYVSGGANLCQVCVLSPPADTRLLGAQLEVGDPQAVSVGCPE